MGVALVTGGARGIGVRGLTQAAAQEWARTTSDSMTGRSVMIDKGVVFA